MRFSFVLLTMMACGAGSDSTADDDDAQVDDQVPAENPYGEGKNCPAFETGTVKIKAGGTKRTLEVELPDNPEGAPVVFAWHWIYSNANETLDYLGVRKLADAGYIVVAPESSGLPYEWDTIDKTDDNVDLALVDAVLPCLFDEFQIDSNAVYATGHSAGGLFTTFLTMHRADVFAATAPFSGGAFTWDYETPSRPIPALMTWGGVSDEYYGFSFHTATLEFLENMDNDGSYTVACEHTAGHLPPPDALDMMEIFFADHRLDAPSPWMDDGIPSGLPAYCEG